MPNIWWDRNRPSSVSESHTEDNSPKTQTPRAPLMTMTATRCHHTAKTVTGRVRCIYVSASRHSSWDSFFLPLLNVHMWVWFVKTEEKKKASIFQNEKLGKKNRLLCQKRKCNFQLQTFSVGRGCVLELLLSNIGSRLVHHHTKSQYSPTYIPFSTRFVMSKAFSTLPSRMSNLTS